MSISTLAAFFHTPVTGRLSLVALLFVSNKDPLVHAPELQRTLPRTGISEFRTLTLLVLHWTQPWCEFVCGLREGILWG